MAIKHFRQRLAEGQDIQQAVNNSYKSYYRFKSNLYKRVKLIIKKEYAYFGTLTLNEENIKLSKKTITNKIKKIFGGCIYVFNEDYGAKGGRLHYHIVVASPLKLPHNLDCWTYGFSFFRRIKNPNDKALSNYLIKLVEHSLKAGTNGICFSRYSFKDITFYREVNVIGDLLEIDFKGANFGV